MYSDEAKEKLVPHVQDWINARCVVGGLAETFLSNLHTDYMLWAAPDFSSGGHGRRGPVIGLHQFGWIMRRLGFGVAGSSKRYVVGLALIPASK